ncbi:hypothetical protein TorRG33x02_092210 [Trema orientale]|uniref:Transmembrane protein n=1 Tax=Trema orientale TaxID=63057 RepID=A0A2P5FB55_TREOI|nr:hypothetical protein TorRG33x02_092210 [Trema orientale]
MRNFTLLLQDFARPQAQPCHLVYMVVRILYSHFIILLYFFSWHYFAVPEPKYPKCLLAERREGKLARAAWLWAVGDVVSSVVELVEGGARHWGSPWSLARGMASTAWPALVSVKERQCVAASVGLGVGATAYCSGYGSRLALVEGSARRRR